MGALLLALAAIATGCSGAVPHHLAAPPIAGTLRVDVERANGWETLPESAWTLESDCSLRVRGVPSGDLVRVRYTSEPGVRCTPGPNPVVRIAAGQPPAAR